MVALALVLAGAVIARWSPRPAPPTFASRAPAADGAAATNTDQGDPSAGKVAVGQPGWDDPLCSVEHLAASLPESADVRPTGSAPRCAAGFAVVRVARDGSDTDDELGAFRLRGDVWENFAITGVDDCQSIGESIETDFPADLCR
jgi:hypothetical protein